MAGMLGVVDPKNCKTCRERLGRQCFTWQPRGEDGEWWYDVQKAVAIVNADPGREVFELPDWNTREVLQWMEPDPGHLDHVDPKYPGIVAPFGDQQVLIDGTHRAARCVRDGLPFAVVFLTEAEADACVIKSPTREFKPSDDDVREVVAHLLAGRLPPGVE
jgi:hypothetical protein